VKIQSRISKAMKQMMNDISTRSDVEKMVVTFYDRVKSDDLLAPLFAHLDWPHHLPIMYNFWSSILLGDMSYNGSPLRKHLNLGLSREHFERWLKLFTANIDAEFSGPVAEEAKGRARTIAGLFQHKMGLSTA
jgi:hemoglobin